MIRRVVSWYPADLKIKPKATARHTEEREHEDRRSVKTQTGTLTPGMCIAFSKMKSPLFVMSFRVWPPAVLQMKTIYQSWLAQKQDEYDCGLWEPRRLEGPRQVHWEFLNMLFHSCRKLVPCFYLASMPYELISEETLLFPPLSRFPASLS